MIRTVSCLALVLLASACGSNSDESSTPIAQAQASPTVLHGAFGAANVSTSCVEGYAAARISHRAFAFDGTVTAIDDPVSNRRDGGDLQLDGVAFDVHEWFVGDYGPVFTADALVANVPDAYRTDVPIETRLIVSGEDRWDSGSMADPIVWGCGFTRYYDEATATAWRAAVAAE